MSEKKNYYELPQITLPKETIGQKRFRTLKLMSFLEWRNPKTSKDLSRCLVEFSEEYNVEFDLVVNELLLYGVKYLLLKFDEELSK